MTAAVQESEPLRITADVIKALLGMVDEYRRQIRQLTPRGRAQLAARNLEIGRMLLKARSAWPRRGPKARGWGEYLAKLGIHQRNALHWMLIASYVETNKSFRVPTLADCGADRRVRKGARR